MKNIILIYCLIFLSGCTYNNTYESNKNDDNIAGYEICINDYKSGLLRTEKEALQLMQDLRKNIKDEDLEYMEFITITYQKD